MNRKALYAFGTVAGLAMSVGAIGGISVASPTSTVFYACMNAAGYVHDISTTPHSCRHHETQVTWNQSGPQAAQGAQGPRAAGVKRAPLDHRVRPGQLELPERKATRDLQVPRGAQVPWGIPGPAVLRDPNVLLGPGGGTGPKGDTGPSRSSVLGASTQLARAGRGTECTLGEIVLTAGFVANGIPADGQTLSIEENTALFSLLGTEYGGNGTTTFQLPDLNAAALDGLTYSICTEAVFPSTD
jgi:Phage Tail Collar Domain